jgi:hypothetical protein
MNLGNHLLKLLVALCADRQALVLENIALRQQIMVMQRSVKKAKLEDSDRAFWILLSRILGNQTRLIGETPLIFSRLSHHNRSSSEDDVRRGIRTGY